MIKFLKTIKMKKTSTIFTAVLMTAMILSSCGGGSKQPNTGSITYEVTIGKQVWMTQNLNVDKFLNGEAIPEAKTKGEWSAYGQAGEAAWCYDPQNGEKSGKLYNWYAVNDPRGLAPKGWHIPSNTEWTELTDYLGGAEKAGAKMKSKEGWGDKGNGTNSSGFSGLPGAFIFHSGEPQFFSDKICCWWSSTEDRIDYAVAAIIEYPENKLVINSFNHKYGISVRCIRDY